MDKRGKFIVFEGGEGSGKDTHIDRLKKKYAGREDIVFTREPGGTPQGEQIRSLLLTPRERKISVPRELVLFVAARAILLEEVILPALAAGKTVISNRFGLSTIAYQIYGRQCNEHLPMLQKLSAFAVGDAIPSDYILLDVTPEVGLARVRSRGDGLTSFDAENLAFHNRVREGYLKHISDYNGLVIDADRPLEEVWATVEAEVANIIG